MDSISAQTQNVSQPAQYVSKPPLMDIMGWLLNLPSIPLSLKDQFFMLWELAPFSNLNENKDIPLLMAEFDIWCDYFMWSIPDIYWGNVLEFARDNNTNANIALDEKPISMDINMLLSMLRQAYYMQLSRAKDGFTVKEAGTIRQKVEAGTTQPKKKGWSLF